MLRDVFFFSSNLSVEESLEVAQDLKLIKKMPIKNIKQYLVKTANKFPHLNVTLFQPRLKTFSPLKKHSKTASQTVSTTTSNARNASCTTEAKSFTSWKSKTISSTFSSTNSKANNSTKKPAKHSFKLSRSKPTPTSKTTFSK